MSLLEPGALLDSVLAQARKRGEIAERGRLDQLSLQEIKDEIGDRTSANFPQLVDGRGNDTSLQTWALMASFNAEVQANPPKNDDRKLITATEAFLHNCQDLFTV